MSTWAKMCLWNKVFRNINKGKERAKHVTMSHSLSNFCESELNRLASPQSSTCDETQMTKPSTSTQWWWGQSELYAGSRSLFVDVPLLAVKEAATSALGAFTHNRALFFFLLALDLTHYRCSELSHAHRATKSSMTFDLRVKATLLQVATATSPPHLTIPI